MAHYAYKHACYDIDYEKYKELVARFEKEQGCEHNGDSNYDGDNWYIVAMWIEELRAENAALAAALVAKDASIKMAVEMIETNAHERRHVRWKLNDALDLKPHAALVAKLKADAVIEYYDYCYSQGMLVSPSDYIERGEV